MNSVILSHCNNILLYTLKDFKIPFIIKNGLVFNKKRVFKYNRKSLEQILINKKKEGFCVEWYEKGKLKAKQQ